MVREPHKLYNFSLNLLREHGLVTGPTKSRKTSLVFSPLVHQLMGLFSNEKWKEQGTILCIDLKGDHAWFHGVLRDSQKMGLPFKWLTIETGKASYGWNMFTQDVNKRMRLGDVTQQGMKGLSMDYGDDYGRGFFMGKIWRFFARCLGDHNIKSFEHLASLADLRGFFSLAEVEGAEAFLNVIRRLALQPVLNVHDDSPSFTEKGNKNRWKGEYGNKVVEQSIKFSSMLSKPQVVYLWLPVTLQGMDSRLIAKLFMSQLLSAANVRNETSGGDEVLPIYVFIDEFQELVGKSDELSIFFAQARSKGVSIIAAHQSMAQLRTMDKDLGTIARESVGFHMRMGMPGVEDMRQMQLEGEGNLEFERVLTRKQELDIGGVVDVEYGSVPEISPRRLRAMAVNPHEAVITVRDPDANPSSDPLMRPEFVTLRHHIAEEEFDKRNTAPWPKVGKFKGTIVAPADYGKPSKNGNSSTAVKGVTDKKVHSAKRPKASTKEGRQFVEQLMTKATSWLDRAEVE